ncbi:methyltransferase domain-containing protein [Microcoleus sp. FACHB-68]|uniref:class I SAM-dependent methyltransferase n=1 Tax=Microcoleus sp. FACHB-68 TaxID=2692826 RepID=UPI001687D40D|nr:methyltransferase domain-containing protein [Microcoleus sp. FACHB-68]MBD1937493.1 class I SAM-dependent methyltransferase [Microcoleus sp. FACHB-68]
MDKQASDEVRQKIRQQFDTAPYPRKPLEASPKDELNFLFTHNLVTPYYLRNQKIIKTEGKVILDAGCGSGYKALALAEANPGAKIVGIDLSEESVKLAQQRLEYHGFENTEFYAISIEELPTLNLKFDYINCDEVLYLLPNPALGLQAMKSVLKPEGIIRANLHSILQRVYYLRAQKVFKIMGLMEENPREDEIEAAVQTMRALKNEVLLKVRTWFDKADEQWILMNYLFQGDKGFTIPEMFSALKTANLEFISMVNWRRWELLDLFNPDDLPAFLAMSLPEIPVEEQLHLFELLNPVHRLLDFWCGHPNQAEPCVPVAGWQYSDWEKAVVHLHPQLKTAEIEQGLLECITNHTSFTISSYIPLPTTTPILLESSIAACLLPLWERALPVMSLVAHWLNIRPVDLVTLEPMSQETAFEEVKELLIKLETFVYVLLERSA